MIIYKQILIIKMYNKYKHQVKKCRKSLKVNHLKNKIKIILKKKLNINILKRIYLQKLLVNHIVIIKNLIQNKNMINIYYKK